MFFSSATCSLVTWESALVHRMMPRPAHQSSKWVLAALSRIHVLEWVVVALLLLYFASVAVGTSALAAKATSVC
jgi:hypothetical protein